MSSQTQVDLEAREATPANVSFYNEMGYRTVVLSLGPYTKLDHPIYVGMTAHQFTQLVGALLEAAGAMNDGTAVSHPFTIQKG